MQIIQLVIAIYSVISCSSVSVDTDNTLFLDQYQRYAIFHGVNVVQKLFRVRMICICSWKLEIANRLTMPTS